jgi:hypothetical protein
MTSPQEVRSVMGWHGVGWFRFDESSINLNAPSAPGLYALIDGTTIVYIGETENLHKRLVEHCARLDDCFSQFVYLRFGYELHLARPARLARREELLQELRPACNELG